MNIHHNLPELLQLVATTLIEVASQLDCHLEMNKAPTPAQTCSAGPGRSHVTSHAFPAASPRRLTTPWPRVERSDLANGMQASVDHPVFRMNYKPAQTVAFYMAGCRGLSELATACQLPLFKLGTTQQMDLLIRQEELRIDRYASAINTAAGYVEDGGWNDWEMWRLKAAPALSPASPIRTTPRALLIGLPATLPFEEFEMEVQNILDNMSLATWSETPVGRQHFATLGVDLSRVRRYTAYRFGSSERFMRAREIYIHRPRSDLADIAARIEQLIVSNVLAHSTAGVAA